MDIVSGLIPRDSDVWEVREMGALELEPRTLSFVMDFKEYRFEFADETLVLTPQEMRAVIKGFAGGGK